MKFSEITKKDKLLTIIFVNGGINSSNFNRLVSLGVASSYSALASKLSTFKKKEGIVINDKYGNWDLTPLGAGDAYNILTSLDSGEVIPVLDDDNDSLQKTSVEDYDALKHDLHNMTDAYKHLKEKYYTLNDERDAKNRECEHLKQGLDKIADTLKQITEWTLAIKNGRG